MRTYLAREQGKTETGAVLCDNSGMQRAKVRRSQATKAAPSRVADLHDAAQFEKLKRKYADRLIVLHTYTVICADLPLCECGLPCHLVTYHV